MTEVAGTTHYSHDDDSNLVALKDGNKMEIHLLCQPLVMPSPRVRNRVRFGSMLEVVLTRSMNLLDQNNTMNLKVQ